MEDLPQVPMQPESDDVNRRRRPHPGAATLKELTVLFEEFVAVGSAKVAQADKDSGPSTWPGVLFGWAKDAVMVAGALAGSLGAVVALILAVKSLRRPGSGQADGTDEA